MHDVTSYMTVSTEVMFTQIIAKVGIKTNWVTGRYIHVQGIKTTQLWINAG